MSPVSHLPTSAALPAPLSPLSPGRVRRVAHTLQPLLAPALAPVLRPVAALRAWPTTAHHQARRNAMVALTECTRRRAEREDVERYLAARAAAADGTAHGAADGERASSTVTVVSRHA
ncbi:hypothetical protein [Nocardioides sp.]|uniref:hypothetical protein n=1 Tax=Nocardioides sp. TaxID=35761 RepID=UPI003511E29B